MFPFPQLTAGFGEEEWGSVLSLSPRGSAFIPFPERVLAPTSVPAAAIKRLLLLFQPSPEDMLIDLREKGRE